MKVFKSLVALVISVGLGGTGLYFGAKYIGKPSLNSDNPTEVVEELPEDANNEEVTQGSEVNEPQESTPEESTEEVQNEEISE